MSSKFDRKIVIGEVKGDCKVTLSPEPIDHAKKNFEIYWHVTNNCSNEREVEVDHFKHDEDNKKEKKVLDIRKGTGKIPAGGTAVIEAKVRHLDRKDYGHYKYDILVDKDVKEDPRLEIDG